MKFVGSPLAWRARDPNTLWHLTAVYVHGQGVGDCVHEHGWWPQCVRPGVVGERVCGHGCACRPAEGRWTCGLSRGAQCRVTSHTDAGTHNGARHLLDDGGDRVCPLPVKNQDVDVDGKHMHACEEVRRYKISHPPTRVRTGREVCRIPVGMEGQGSQYIVAFNGSICSWTGSG